MPPQTLGYLCSLVGLSMIAGWWIAFRNRPYLLLLGLFFMSLSTFLVLTGRLQTGPITEGVKAARWIALSVGIIFFIGALIFAVQESKRRFQEMREHYQAAADALVAMTQAELQRQQQRQETPKQEVSDTQEDSIIPSNTDNNFPTK